MVGGADQAAGPALWRTCCKSVPRFKITAVPSRVLSHSHRESAEAPNRDDPSFKRLLDALHNDP